MKPYERAEKKLTQLKRSANNAFRRLSVLPFDSLNVLETRQQTEKTYSRLDRSNRAAYLEIAQGAYKDAVRMYDFTPKKEPDKKWILAFLLALNPVTKYLYDKEVERKRLRLAEAMAADREYGNPAGLQADIRTHARAWWRQTEQYAIDIEDAAVLYAFEEAGIEEVKWVAEIDGRECKTCRERNGKVYKINQVPEKPHYLCRCYLVPVSAEKP